MDLADTSMFSSAQLPLGSDCDREAGGLDTDCTLPTGPPESQDMAVAVEELVAHDHCLDLRLHTVLFPTNSAVRTGPSRRCLSS